MEHGFKWLLLQLLVVRTLTQSCRALSTAPKQVQLPAVDPAKQYAADFRMQATSYAAYMMVRDYQTSDASHCNYPGLAADVCQWSAKDPGWERLVRAESMVAIAHQAFQAAEYDEAIIALEESLALRLFAYTDQKTLDRWQQGLVMPGAQYKHDKKSIANSLVLRSDCLVHLARSNQDVVELTEATELLQLAAAELQAAQSLTADSISAISSRLSSIANLAAELLPRLSARRLHELLEQHGISCSSRGSNATSAQPPEWCDSSSGKLLLHLVPLLRLPVCLMGPKGKLLLSSLGCGSSLQQGGQQQQQQPHHQLRQGQVPKVEPVSDPFSSFGMALLQRPCEVVAHYLQRMFFRLLSVVPVEYMRDLDVPCQRTDSRSRCISYLPTWVTAQAVTIDKRTGRAHVTGPSSCAVGSSRGTSDAAACAAVPRGSNSCHAGSSCSACSCSSQSGSCSSNSNTEQSGGVDVCGFVHIKAVSPGTQLPRADAQHMSMQQRETVQQAADAAAVYQGIPVSSSCSVSDSDSGRCKASSDVYYYFFPDIPAVLEHVIITQETDKEDSSYLFTLLDDVTLPYNFRQWSWMAQKGTECTEAALLEGRAPPHCSVLIPSIGDCSGVQPQANTPLSQIPSNLLPLGRMRTTAAAAAAIGAAAAAASPAGAGCGAAPAAASRSRCSDGGEADRGEGGVSKLGRRQKHSPSDEDADILTSSIGSSRRNSNGSKRRRSKQSADPYLDAPPYPHMYSSFARVDREIADRQLLEQMNKLQRDKQHKQQDGPLIPLTLGMLVLMCCLPFIASRFRRVSSRQPQQQQQQQGVIGWLRGRKGASVSVAAAAAGTNSSAFGAHAGHPCGNVSSSAAVSGTASSPAAAGGMAPALAGSIGSSAPDSSHLQRLAAAAVKAALSSSDLDSMEAALRQAEGAGMGGTANCVRLRELLAKRRRQAQQAKRQEQMRQQEQARRGRRRKGHQDAQGAAAAAAPVLHAGNAQQQKQGKKGGGGKAPSAFFAWLTSVFLPVFRKRQNAALGGGSSKGLDRVSDSSSNAAAADGVGCGISRSCSSSSSRSASSSMISSSASGGAGQLQLLAETTSNSSRGCSPATSVSCSPQSSIGLGAGHQQALPESHSGDTLAPPQQQQQRSAGRRSGRGSVTVAVAPRGSTKHNQQQQVQGLGYDATELAQNSNAVRDARFSSSSSSGSSSPHAVSAANRLSAAAGPGHERAQQQQQKVGNAASHTDATSPVGSSAAGSLPIHTPPKSSGSGSGNTAKALGTAAVGKGAKGKQQRQALSVSAAAHGSNYGYHPPTAVITVHDGSGSIRSSSNGTPSAAVAAVGVEPPATPAGAVSASPLRSDRHHHQQQQQQLPPPWQQQQQQQRHTVRTGMSWLEAALPSKQRAAAVSDDGTTSNSSSCLNSPAGAQQQQQQQGASASTHSTPTKAKLNPKAAPYNPKGLAASPVPAGAAAAAMANASPGCGCHSPAPNAAGLVLTPSPQGAAAAPCGSSGGSSWPQQHSMLGARAVGSGGNLAAAAAGVASMLQHQDSNASVTRRLSCNGLLEPSAVGGMGGLPPPGNLMGGMSAAAAARLQGGQTMQQMLLQQQHYGLLSPHSAAGMQQAAAWQQQQQLQELQREEQLMAMLSALSPGEASAAAAMRMRGAGSSAPQPLGTAGSSGSSGVTSTTGGVHVDSSSSSSGDLRGHFMGAVAAHGLNWMSNSAGPDGPGVGLGRPPLGSRSTPPGLSGALSWQQQQQQQQFQKPGRISLPQDLDFQLPPGFLAETFPASGTPGSTTGGPYSSSSGTGGAGPGPGAFSPVAAPAPGLLASPASGVGMPVSSAAMLAGGSNPWTYVPAQGKPATPLLIVSEAAAAGPLGLQGYVGHGGQAMDMGHAMNMDMDHSMVAAAAATSMNVAELVLGSSPPPVAHAVAQTLHGVEELFYKVTGSNGGGSGSNGVSNGGGSGSNGSSGMTAADADAYAARLADEMTAGVLLD